MPRKPTLHAREARHGLLAMIERLPAQGQLPTLSELGKRFALHPSTIFRLLRDLADEGQVWQSPQGKFHAPSARRTTLRGAPLCFIGREMWQWSRLYQEILEGIAEVCGANGSPLVLLSSRNLVRQASPSSAPKFASLDSQKVELRSILTAAPRGCAGYLFDHLWQSSAIGSVKHLGGEMVQLLEGTRQHAEVIAPDYQAGATLVTDFLQRQKLSKIGLVVPFKGDPAIDLAGRLLRKTLTEGTFTSISFSKRSPLIRDNLRNLDALICYEDNVADALIREFSQSLPLLIATQGTGTIHSPQVRLRIDYRRLGRAAASRILHGTKFRSLKPALVTAQDD